MKKTSPDQMVIGDKSGIDLSESRPSLQALLREQEQQLQPFPRTADPLERARLRLDIAETLLALQRRQESWDMARGDLRRVCRGGIMARRHRGL